MVVGEAEEKCSPECGCPKAPQYHPHCFQFFFDDLLSRVSKREGIGVQGFVNDMFLWIRGNFRRGITSPKLMLALRDMDRWSSEWLLTFDPKKCKTICFRGPWIRIDRDLQARLVDLIIDTDFKIRYL